MFELFALSGHVILNGDESPMLFASFLEAKAYSVEQGFTEYKPRKVRESTSTPAWHAREAARFDREYTAPPFSYLGSWMAIVEANPLHFVHVSRKQQGKLAYTESARKGEGDVQTPITLDEYLTRYAPDMDAAERETIEHVWSRSTSSAELSFVRDSAEMARLMLAFESTRLSSCMTGFDVNESPYLVYGTDAAESGATSDITLALLKTASGEAIARCLVWEEKKQYGRIFGDTKLAAALRQEGFTSGDFSGARIKAIPHPDAEYDFVMPYLDSAPYVTRRGAHFVIGTRGEHNATGTTGRLSGAQPEPERLCDSCDEGCDETTDVHVSLRRTQSWCPDCAQETFYCHGLEATCADSMGSSEVDGDTYCDAYAERHFSRCDHTKEYTREDRDDVVVDRSGAIESWSETSRQEDAFKCRKDGVTYAKDLLSPHMERGEDPICILNDERNIDFRRVAGQGELPLESPPSFIPARDIARGDIVVFESRAHALSGERGIVLCRGGTGICTVDFGRGRPIETMHVSYLSLSPDSSPIESPTPRFAVGDKVVLARKSPEDLAYQRHIQVGAVGTIRHDDASTYPFHISFGDGLTAWARNAQLEVAPIEVAPIEVASAGRFALDGDRVVFVLHAAAE